MNHFGYRDGRLHCEEVPLEQIAQQVGTPCYVYSVATLTRHFNVFQEALADIKHLICYSVKACSNLAILRLLADLGAGFDIVSGGELFRLQAAQIPTDRVVYSGVGKTPKEMRLALQAGIHCFNVESIAELRTLDEVARSEGKTAPVSLRVNPDVDPQTHPYISTGLLGSKFGIPWNEAVHAYRVAADCTHIDVVGLDCHIGSQLMSLDPFLEALDRMLELVKALRDTGHNIYTLDLGGGLGIPYNPNDKKPPHPRELGEAVRERTTGYGLTLLFEPGRVIVGNAGVLLMRVLYNKTNGDKRFVIVDAAMNDSIRPALYDAYHNIQPILEPDESVEALTVDVVGPICESGDFFARDREIAPVTEGDLLALMSSGGYGFSMSSNYNSRTRVAEVLVAGDQFAVIRDRESYDDLVRGEHLAEHLRNKSNQ